MNSDQESTNSGISLYQGFINSNQYKLWKNDFKACWDQLVVLAQKNSSVVSTTLLFNHIAHGVKKWEETSHAILSVMLVGTFQEYAFLFKHAMQAVKLENIDLIKTSSHNIPFETPKRCGFEGEKWNDTNNVPCIKLKVYFNVRKDDNSLSAFENLNDKMIVDLWMKEDFTPLYVLFCFASED